MNTLFTLLTFQALLGAFDNLWHHEWQARLPQRQSARYELTLHAMREALYGILFFGLAWRAFHGLWALGLALLLVAELLITLADFLEEDRSRRLPPLERLLHTVLTVSYGSFIALFTPLLIAWFSESTGLVNSDHGWVSWLFTAYAVGVWAWSVRNAIAVYGMYRDTAANSPTQSVANPISPLQPAMLITGATGFIGSALVAQLRRNGQRLIVLSRDALQAKAMLGDGVWVVDNLAAIPSETRIDSIIQLAGASVLGRPWTDQQRLVLQESRINLTEQLVKLMRRMQHTPKVLVCASAVGYYGVPTHDMPVAETHAAEPGRFQSDLCIAVEHEANRAQALGVRVVCLRFGIVLGMKGGALPMQALAARLGLAAVLGNGRQPLPWIHLSDALALIQFAVRTPELSGGVNAVAPTRLSQSDFSHALALAYGQRVHLRMPAAPLRWLLGEMSELLLQGQNVVPEKALNAGFQFQFSHLDSAFSDLISSTASAEKLDARLPTHHY